MDEGEKAEREAALYKSVRTYTSHIWAAVLVKMLLTIAGSERSAKQTPYLDKIKFQTKYATARKRLLMFDYDVRSSVSFCACGYSLIFYFTSWTGDSHTDSKEAQHGCSIRKNPRNPRKTLLGLQEREVHHFLSERRIIVATIG